MDVASETYTELYFGVGACTEGGGQLDDLHHMSNRCVKEECLTTQSGLSKSQSK